MGRITPLTREQIEEAVAAVNREGSLTKAANSLGIARSTLTERLKKAGKFVTATTVSKPKVEAVKVGRALTEFRKEYDKDIIVPAKIKEGLKLLGSGWEYEVPFARAIGVSLQDIAIYREQFADYIIPLRKDNKRVWAGTKTTANTIREILL